MDDGRGWRVEHDIGQPAHASERDQLVIAQADQLERGHVVRHRGRSPYQPVRPGPAGEEQAESFGERDPPDQQVGQVGQREGGASQHIGHHGGVRQLSGGERANPLDHLAEVRHTSWIGPDRQARCASVAGNRAPERIARRPGAGRHVLPESAEQRRHRTERDPDPVAVEDKVGEPLPDGCDRVCADQTGERKVRTAAGPPDQAEQRVDDRKPELCEQGRGSAFDRRPVRRREVHVPVGVQTRQVDGNPGIGPARDQGEVGGFHRCPKSPPRQPARAYGEGVGFDRHVSQGEPHRLRVGSAQ
jgi:hypothetical protein